MRVHLRKRISTLDQPQQAEQVGAGIFEGWTEGHDCSVHLLAARALVIVPCDPKKTLQQVGFWEGGPWFSGENWKGFQNTPTPLVARPEFMEQARLADSGLSHCRDDLAVPGLCQLGGVLHRVHLALAAHELGVTACRCPLQARPQRSQSGHLVDVDRFTNPLDLGWSEGSEKEIALTELANLFCCRD